MKRKGVYIIAMKIEKKYISLAVERLGVFVFISAQTILPSKTKSKFDTNRNCWLQISNCILACEKIIWIFIF